MAKPFTAAEIRKAYLDFFASKGCEKYHSASLVPENDPTTLFTVAGMAQFKDMFLGRGSLPFSKATTCQKCIRTNDIMNVGRTPRHHTFFEMLGNFSFNDYFKREAIQWAWEFLTEVCELDETRLSISVNHRDDDAYKIWNDEVGVPAERIHRMGDDDNFWPASAPTEGPTGPGGNCSEIFWDFQTNDDPDDNLTKDSGRFVEIWNLVFPEFNVAEPKVDGRYTLEELGRTNIDTGMGLERMACVMQGVYNNFDTDIMQTIVQKVSEVAGVAYVANADGEQGAKNELLRRIADHVRAVSFCVADGALPGNTGRGYIVRRLVRRATLDIDKLGVDTSRLYEIVPAVVAAMGNPYEEVAKRADQITEIFKVEEDSFRKTLRRGLDLFGRALARHQEEGLKTFSGDDAFELFTTYGFPIEVTEELAEAEGLPVDQEQFQKRMDEFAEISKGGKTIEVFTESALMDAKPRLGATPFIGYDDLEAEVSIALLELDGKEVDEAPEGSSVRIALDATPFYAESGGQVADDGLIEGDGFIIIVTDVQKDDGLVVHHGLVQSGPAHPGKVTARVNANPRFDTTRHHSATHLLHSALGAVLGDHVEQQGSKVEPSALRFDFNHGKGLSAKELAKVESWVSEAIAADHAVDIQEVDINKARELGAKAQFGEKYGDVVRVVTMGSKDVSIEFCGGCHVKNTADIGSFRIVREEASSAGIRRITALAGGAALRLKAEETKVAEAVVGVLGGQVGDARAVGEIAQALKVTIEEVPERVQQLKAQADELAKVAGEGLSLSGDGVLPRFTSLQSEIKRLRKAGEKAAAAAAMAAVDDLVGQAQEIEGLKVVSAKLAGVDGKSLRQAGERLRQLLEGGVVALASDAGGKAMILVAAGEDAVKAGVKAGQLVGAMAKVVGGGGGGKPDLAQAGGKDPAKIDEALALLPNLLHDAVRNT